MSGGDDSCLPACMPGPRQSMSLPHNVRPDQMVGPETPGARWKRFQPLKKLQRMFRRKSKTKEEEEEGADAPKSFSASQLPPASRRRLSGRDSPPLQSRLSMSHDSIFQSEGGSGAQGAEMGSALSIPSVPGASGQLTAELRGVLLKRRADDSDDDPGLPHSPASPSTPPAASRRQAEHKGQSGKSGGSCSDGSLLSMYSSDTCTDDDIFGPLSKHPSRASLGRDPDGLELETTAALSHSAAKHRIAVRPRRNHGVPRQRRSRARPTTGPAAVTSLPPTVEEESPPSTPTVQPTAATAAARPSGSSSAQLISDKPRRAPSASPSRSQSIRAVTPEGAAASVVSSGSPVRPTQVKRSKSSVGDGRLRDVSPRKFWSRDPPPATAAAAAELDDKRAEKGETFFSRIFGSRRSGRKKKDDRSLSPELVTVEPTRRPPVPRHRSQFGSGDHRSSPASALHADVIRPPPSEASRAAELVEPQPAPFPRTAESLRPADMPRSVDLLRSAEAPRSADFSRPTEPVRPVTEFPRATEPTRPMSEVPRPPPEALRRGPAFLADVRAEVAALAAGGDRGDDTVTVSPQVARRHRASAMAAVGRPTGAGTESPRVRPRFVGLTAYQQRVAHLKRSPSPEAAPSAAARRSFSCENVSEEDPTSRPCSGMALGSVLSLIKSTTAAERQQPSREEDEEPVRAGSEETEAAVSVPPRADERRESADSPTAGPKSLDSSLLSSPTAEPPPAKASSAESVQGGGQERTARGSSDRQLPEFLRIQLHRVEGRQQRDSTAGQQRVHSPTAESRAPADVERRDSSERETASSPAISDDSPPQLRRSGPAAVRPGSPNLPRRPSQTRSRCSGGSSGSADAEPVVLRAKSTAASSEDSELLKVFKRRSLRSRDSEDLPAALSVELGPAAGHGRDGAPRAVRGADSDEKENEQPREETEETVVCVSVPASPPRRSEPPRPLSSDDGEPPRRVSVSRRDSEAVRRPSGQEDDASRPPGWLKQAVRERREQREQREQKHLRPVTQKELFIESESGQSGRGAGPSRSSRVLEMANTFQKLQTT